MANEQENKNETTPEGDANATATVTKPDGEPGEEKLTDKDVQMLRVHHELTGADLPSYLKEEAEPDSSETPEVEASVAGEVQDEPSDGKEATSASVGDKTEDGQTTETSTQEPGTGADPGDLAKAKDALKKWQWPDEIIGSMPDSVIIERGGEAAKSQADFNRIANERVNFRRRYEEVVAEKEAEVKARKSESSDDDDLDDDLDDDAVDDKAKKSSQEPSSLDEILKPLADDEIYADMVAPIKKAFEAVQGQSPKVGALYDQIDEMNLELTRNRLVSDVPSLAEGANYEAVKTRAYQLAKLKGYHDSSGNPLFEKLLRDASRLELGEDNTSSKVKGDLQARFNQQTSGQPMGTGKGPDPTSGMSRDDKMIKAQEMLGQGLAWEEVRSKLASIPDG